MNDDTGSTSARALVIGLLIVATLGFGAAGLCGAVFTLAGLADLGRGGPENYASAMLVIALPSLLIGGGLAWWCGRALRRRWRGDRA